MGRLLVLFVAISVAFSGRAAAQGVYAGLVAHYPLTGIADDVSGNSNNGTTNGGITWAGDGCSFNGTNAYIEAANSSSLQSPTKRVTIASWVYVNAWYATNTAPVCAKANSSSNGQYGLFLTSGPADQGLHLRLGSVDRYGAYTFALNRWYFVAAAWDSSRIVFYVDGAPIDTVNYAATVPQDSYPLQIGVDRPGGTEWLNGKLRDLYIYNRALSYDEIQIIYAGLVAHYPLTGIADDVSGNSNNGTTNGGITWAGDGCSFNGTNAYIEAANSSSLQSPTKRVTIASWVYVNAWYATNTAPVCAKANSSSNGQYGLFLTSGPADQGLHLRLGSVDRYGAYTFALNRWYFVAAAWDSSRIVFYVDGAPIDTVNYAATVPQDSYPLQIGVDRPGGTEWLNGKLRDLYIYNRALSYDEVWGLYITITDDAGEQEVGLAARFDLFQNYPNPFNPSTTIRYGLPQRSQVTLTVFNTLGQQVAVLVQGSQEAGYHDVVFDAKGLASGVYFYRMQAGSFSEVRKLALLK